MSRCCPLWPLITLLVAVLLVLPHVATAWVVFRGGSPRQGYSSSQSSSVPTTSSCTSISIIISRERRRSILVLKGSSSTSSSSLEEVEEEDEDEDVSSATISSTAAEKLLRKAEQLRQEVASLEQSKRAVQLQEERNVEQKSAATAAQRERYSAILPILKPDGTTVEERVDFKPRYKDGSSSITTCYVSSLPLGIVLGECEGGDSNEDNLAGCTMVDEVTVGSNGAMAGLRPGDIVRAISACRVTMETPTWQLVLGGIGVPKTVRFMYAVDSRPFDEVMDAVVSNRQDAQRRPVLLVVERREQQE